MNRNAVNLTLQMFVQIQIATEMQSISSCNATFMPISRRNSFVAFIDVLFTRCDKKRSYTQRDRHTHTQTLVRNSLSHVRALYVADRLNGFMVGTVHWRSHRGARAPSP